MPRVIIGGGAVILCRLRRRGAFFFAEAPGFQKEKRISPNNLRNPLTNQKFYIIIEHKAAVKL